MTWNYIAGFFDGEGSITFAGKGYRVTISQTNYKVLDDIKKYSNIGDIFKETKRQKHWRDSWVFYVAKQEKVLLFLKKVKPFLIVKKENAEKAILELETIVLAIKAKNTKSLKLKKDAKILRGNGLTYRKIGKQLGIDFGHARRLVLKK